MGQIDLQWKLAGDLWDATLNHYDADLVIQSGQRHFHVHQFLFKIRSPYLRSMIEFERLKGNTTPGGHPYDQPIVIRLEDDPDLVSWLIKYIYTGKFRYDTNEDLIRLLFAGEHCPLFPFLASCLTECPQPIGTCFASCRCVLRPTSAPIC